MSETGEAAATYFDGITSRRRAVTLRLGIQLDIVEDGAVVTTWPLPDIRRLDGPPDMLRLSCPSVALQPRLDVADPAAIATLTAACPNLGSDAGGRAQVGRIVGWSLAAIASIVMVVLYGIPILADRLAPLVPHSFERRIGQAVDVQVRALFGRSNCQAPQGQAALAALVDKVRTASGLIEPLEANVLATKIENALALPGGKVYLLDGLLQRSNSPDEIAGILAHELGHVHHRHTMRTLIYNGGTSFLIGLLLGDVTGGAAVIFATRQLLEASHSREAEEEADAFAYAAMRNLGRSPVPMAELLLRITGAQKKQLGGITILNSHPLTEDRLAAARRLDAPPTGPAILSAAEWEALRGICRTRSGER